MTFTFEFPGHFDNIFVRGVEMGIGLAFEGEHPVPAYICNEELLFAER